jgi:hypothetical protein
MKVLHACLWFISPTLFLHDIFQSRIKFKYFHTSETHFPVPLKDGSREGSGRVKWILATAHELNCLRAIASFSCCKRLVVHCAGACVVDRYLFREIRD